MKLDAIVYGGGQLPVAEVREGMVLIRERITHDYYFSFLPEATGVNIHEAGDK